MTRFKPAQFAAAAAVGEPRSSSEFADDDEWHEYQNQFCAVFWPDEPLPPVGDKKRRLRWKAATRQHSKIEAARAALADISITLVPPSAQSASAAVQSTAYVVDLATSVAAAAAAKATSATIQATSAASPGAASSVGRTMDAHGSPPKQPRTGEKVEAERLAAAASAGTPPIGGRQPQQLEWLAAFGVHDGG